MNKIVFILMLTAFNLNGSFSDKWSEMQRDYRAVKKMHNYNNTFKYTNEFYNKLVSDLDKLVMGIPNINFLKNSCLTGIMVRGIVPELELYEETFLSECISNQTKSLIFNYKENNQNLLDTNCIKFNCSSTTLGHLYYVAKILELAEGFFPKLILEVGGGFGNLAKCLKKILPNSTVIIIDLPEMCVIQKMFLNTTAPEVDVFLHKNSGHVIQQGAINLVPLCFLENLSIKPDLFVSTFALSESPKTMQDFIMHKNFFGAQHVFITGQINGWSGLGHSWMVSHDSIIGAVRKNYYKTICTPFHWIKKEFLSYEIYGGPQSVC